MEAHLLPSFPSLSRFSFPYSQHPRSFPLPLAFKRKPPLSLASELIPSPSLLLVLRLWPSTCRCRLSVSFAIPRLSETLSTTRWKGKLQFLCFFRRPIWKKLTLVPFLPSQNLVPSSPHRLVLHHHRSHHLRNPLLWSMASRSLLRCLLGLLPRLSSLRSRRSMYRVSRRVLLEKMKSDEARESRTTFEADIP